ncbi:unnamed protein product [Parascedosporium putredinis]|uniref:Helicase C-terminal domain-containing protein n=1 Tax=Parascedosporium putredinis TaxID=1442378 RepID=A0A9P1HC02_9PEZI|nr:unnamed protein product [Parascedosporium putredinis]CAI8004400.1 unnamed protein product [Parascedosporium putredinis]
MHPPNERVMWTLTASPQKTEVVDEIDLDPNERLLYNFFRDRAAKLAAGLSDEGEMRQRKRSSDGSRGGNIVTLINFLRRICDHGEEMLPDPALQSWKEKNDNVDWDMLTRFDDGSEACEQSSQMTGFPNEPSTEARLKRRLSLVTGNHVHLLEPHWNPMAEAQALNRVHRIGQEREVTVRRYIVKDTIENKLQKVLSGSMTDYDSG